MSAVYKAIASVQSALAKTGIEKKRKNSQGSGYMFRGIDDVYAALAPLLAEHGLVVIPRMIERNVVERSSKSGGALFYTTVKAEFDFVGVEDASQHTACTYGEAMDSGDKSTNKAMSAAYKYAAFLTFAIPTEGDNDADGSTHEVAAEKPKSQGESPPHAADPVTDEQRDVIQTLAPAAGRTVQQICQLYEIESLKLLTAGKAAKLIQRLQDDIKAKADKPAVPELVDDDIPY